MSKIKMDLETAKWVADKAQNDIAAFPVEFVECEKCGAVFMPDGFSKVVSYDDFCSFAERRTDERSD